MHPRLRLLRFTRSLFPFLLFGLSLSCAGNRDAGDDDRRGPGEDPRPGEVLPLLLQPADLEVTLDGKSPMRIPYRVDRAGKEITNEATLTVDDSSLGSFEGGSFVYRAGGSGKTTIRARRGEEVGETTLTVRVETIVIGPDTPANAPGRFGGPEDARKAPELVYPPDGALIPPNLSELDFQFRPKEADLFEVRIVTDTLDLRIFTVCKALNGGCTFRPDETMWKLLSNAGRNRTAQITLRGTTLAGGGVGRTSTTTLSFAREDMQGGIYYWAASAGGVMRYDFGRRAQRAESFYDPLRAIAICVGCHAMSRNGKSIAVGMNIPGPASLRTLDVATRGKLFEVPGGPGVGGSDFQAWSSDGQWLVTNEYGGLTVRDGKTGDIQGVRPLIPNANMPDLSPDGSLVVFSRGAGTLCLPPLICPTLSVTSGGLFTAPFKGKDGFGPPVEIVPAGGGNNYYPAFSPDGKFIVYNHAASGDSYANVGARVRVVATAGGVPIDLTATNVEVGNSWPKWSPFQHHFKTRNILWFTFAGKRPVGLTNPAGAQIWLVPVDVAKLAAGEDPGYPPIWLPFQDANTDNRIAQWVEKVNRAPCSAVDMTGCGPTEQCVDGYCTPVIQ